MIRPTASYLALLAAALVLAPGCAEGPVKADPAMVAQLRERYVLSEEPDGAVSALVWRDEQTADQDEPADGTDAPTPADDRDVLIGRVGGMPNPWGDTEPDFPWRQGEAVFFLVDAATADEFADHAAEAGDSHEGCLFCAREAAEKTNAIAAVRFVDANGEPIKVDARELFGFEAGDLVVVRGRASLLGGDLLMLDADGLHVRR